MSPQPTRQRGTLARPDCSSYYEITGPTSGNTPVIIFAHGLGGNHLSWFQQVAYFAPTHTCITFAHRGFNPSTMPPAGPDPAAYADDLAALVAHLNLGDHRIVAQSMGGWTTVEYALRKPPGLKAAVLAATIGTIDPQKIPAQFLPALADWQAQSTPALEGFMRDGIHPAGGARMAAEQPAMHLLYKHIDDQNAALDKQALRLKLMHSRHRAPAELATTGIPILLLANDEDMVIPPPAMEGTAASNPNTTFARIARAGHSGYFERPAEFNAAVEAFFKAHK